MESDKFKNFHEYCPHTQEYVNKMFEFAGSDSCKLLVFTLADGTLSVDELRQKIGKTNSIVSNHISKLRYAGLVKPLKISQKAYYKRTKIGDLILHYINMIAYYYENQDEIPELQ